MAKKITELTELTAIATGDLFIVEDVSTSTTKKITWDNLVEDNSITAPKLATNTIKLAAVTTTTDFSTVSATVVQLTGLTSTVTIPSGGRSIEITVSLGNITNTVGLTTPVVQLWDGTVGSGTQLAQWRSATLATANYFSSIHGTCVVTPAAGSKTYNVGVFSTAGNNVTFAATAAAPNLLEIKVI